MPFLCGALAGARSRLYGIGTGAANNERSRRHTMSSFVASTSSLPGSPLETATLYTNSFSAGHDDQSILQEPTSRQRSTKRNRHKSVTFSLVDEITHIPSPDVSMQPPLSNRPSTTAISDNGSKSCSRDKNRVHASKSRRYTMPGLSQNDKELLHCEKLRGQSPATTSPILIRRHTVPQQLYFPENDDTSSSFNAATQLPRKSRSAGTVVGDHQHTTALPTHIYLLERYTILSLASRFKLMTHQGLYTPVECLALLDKKTASELPSYFSPPKLLVEGTGTFFISQARNDKGLGMFAKRSLRTGEIILTEFPILVLPTDMPDHLQIVSSATVTPTFKEDGYERIIEMLSKQARSELVNLSRCGAHERYGCKTSAYETLARINPLAVSFSSSSVRPGSPSDATSIYRGIFLKTGKCNHSCGPNAEWIFDPSCFTLSLTSIRPIAECEEITIAYVPPYLPFCQRRSDLKRHFGFDCHCDWCLRILSQQQHCISRHWNEESDAARTFLTNFWDSCTPLEAWCQGRTSFPDDFLISAHKKALWLIERDGLEVLSGSPPVGTCKPSSNGQQGPLMVIPDVIRHTDAIAFCYGALSDGVNFREWILRALEVRLSRFVGTDSWMVDDFYGVFIMDDWVGMDDDFWWTKVEDYRSFNGFRDAVETWIEDPECFPGWGLRRSSAH